MNDRHTQIAQLGDSDLYGLQLDDNGGPEHQLDRMKRTDRLLVTADQLARIAVILAEPAPGDEPATSEKPSVNSISREIIDLLRQNGIPVAMIDDPQPTSVHTVPYNAVETAAGRVLMVLQWHTVIGTDQPDKVMTLLRETPTQVGTVRVVNAGKSYDLIDVYTTTPPPTTEA